MFYVIEFIVFFIIGAIGGIVIGRLLLNHWR
jgi:hypothetical protein